MARGRGGRRSKHKHSTDAPAESSPTPTQPEPPPPPAIIELAREWHQDYEPRRAYHRVKYDLEPERHAALFNAQRGRCFICEEKRPLVVDHDHDSGKVRGLLCAQCNSAIGFLGDSTVNLSRAITYLNTVGIRKRKAKQQLEIEKRREIGKRGEKAG